MNRFRMKLTLILLAMIGISVLGSGIFAADQIKDNYLQSIRESLDRELHVIRASVPWPESGEATRSYFQDWADELERETGLRATFIDGDGNVLADSEFAAEQMNNHLERPEIQKAIVREDTGSASRFSDTLQESMIYAALPVEQDGEIVGFIRLARNIELVDSHIRRLWSYLIIGLLVLFVAAGIVSWRLAQGLTRPLERITKAAEQITHMNYFVRVNVRSKDEIGKLGEAINTMAVSLQQQLERIFENESRLKNVLDNMISGVLMVDRHGKFGIVNKSAEELLGFSAGELEGRTYDQAHLQTEFVELIRDGMERKEHIREELIFYFPYEHILEIHLIPMVQQDGEWMGLLIVMHNITAIRRLEKMRSEFVANVSHELKTPIAAIKGFAETLMAGAVKDPQIAESFLKIIYDESERLNRLVMDILDLSKIESKRIPLHLSPIHLNEFVAQTVKMISAQAEKKQIALETRVDDELYIEADEDRLRQILINLMSNGISYTANGGRVRVTAETAGSPGTEHERIRLIVEDNGIGIPKKDLSRIFERFYRVDKARSRSSGGTGLGLSIVKHLVELHRGTIQVESVVGVGTKFIIELPVLH